MKRFTCLLLALAMVVCLLPIARQAEAAKALPKGVLYYWDFEDDSDLTPVGQTAQRPDSPNDAANYDLLPINQVVMIAEKQGAVGNALYLDGKYGVKLDDLEALESDCFTISFWVNAQEPEVFAPALHMGRHIGSTGIKTPTAWLDFTRTAWGEKEATLFPVAWSRNSQIASQESPDGVWAWMADEATEFGMNQWCMVTLVADGERYTAEDGLERIGTKLYVDGKLIAEANAENKSNTGIAPEILQGEDVEGYVGINYSDTPFTGFIDELYIFDNALDEEAIVKMFQEVEPAVPAPTAPTVKAPVVTKDPTSESVNEGGNAYFVSRGENYNYINWFLVNADHSSRISVTQAPWSFPGLSVSGEGTTTLLLSNIPLSLNGWCVEATFTGDGGKVTSKHCYVNVTKAPKIQLWASPSSGYFEYRDQPIQLNAGPNDSIYYEMYVDGKLTSGTVASGQYVTIPAYDGLRYEIHLYAHVVGDNANAISCEYTMDCLPSEPTYPTTPPTPEFTGGAFADPSGNAITLNKTGEDTFSATMSVIGLTGFDGTAVKIQDIFYLTLNAPNGSQVKGTFNGSTFTVEISGWDLFPAGDSLSGFSRIR